MDDSNEKKHIASKNWKDPSRKIPESEKRIAIKIPMFLNVKKKILQNHNFSVFHLHKKTLVVNDEFGDGTGIDQTKRTF